MLATPNVSALQMKLRKMVSLFNRMGSSKASDAEGRMGIVAKGPFKLFYNKNTIPVTIFPCIERDPAIIKFRIEYRRLATIVMDNILKF